MKRKILILIEYFILVTLFYSCCWIDPSSCDDPDPIEYTYEEAIAIINSFKNELVGSTNAVTLKSTKSARPGEVWIYDDCMESIDHYSASPIDDYQENDYSLIDDNLNSKTYEFHWENSWTQKLSMGADIKYELLETVIKAATENSEVHSLDFKLSFKDPQYIRVKNISSLVNEYENYLNSNNEKADGNIMISALIKGKLHIEFKAFNENKQQIEFDLSAKLNEFLVKDLSFIPNYQYFRDKGSSNGFTIIEESGENPTVFAIEYYDLSTSVQNNTVVPNVISEYCDNDEILISYKNVKGKCLNSGKYIVDLRIESGASINELYLHWTNKTNVPITLLKSTLTVRNRFGQILEQESPSVTGQINPGVTLSKGTITTFLQGGYNYNLSDVEFELVITEVRNDFDIICN